MKRLILLTVCIIAGMLKTLASENLKTVTYTFYDSDKCDVEGEAPTGSSVDYNKTSLSDEYFYLSKDEYVTFKLKGYDGNVIKSLTMLMSSNKSAGSGSFSFKVGGTVISQLKSKPFSQWYNMTDFSRTQTKVNVTIDGTKYPNGITVGENEVIEIAVSATVNSLYVYGFTITYEPADFMPQINGSLGDNFYRRQRVTMSCKNETDVIYYTMDGSEPTTESEKYTDDKEIFIDKTTTFKAFAMRGEEKSKVYTKVLTRKDNIKAIIGKENDNYFVMGKTRIENALKAEPVDIYGETVIWGIDELKKYAWITNDDKTVKSYGSDLYLSDNDTKTELSAVKTEWTTDEYGIKTSPEAGIIKYLMLSHYNEYFGAYRLNPETWPCGKYYNVVKGYLRKGATGNFGTICMPFDVLPDDRVGATYYNIIGKNTEGGKVVSLVLEEETGKLIAGQPYIFSITAGNGILYNMYLDTAGEKDVAADKGKTNNGLHGSLTTINIDPGTFIIKNNKIVKCGNSCGIEANRAYINMEEVPDMSSVMTASPKRTIEIGIDNDATSIGAVTSEHSDVYYNMQGQRVVTPKKGLYIVNGKKRIVR